MNALSAEKKLAVISALVEGNSIRSISRIDGRGSQHNQLPAAPH